MKTSTTKGLFLAAIVTSITLLSGCATKTVVVPKHGHAHNVKTTHHVVYKVRPAKKHCWKHRGHWDCR